MTTVQSKGKRYFQLILLILGAGAIYPLIYLRTQFQEPILLAFDIDVAQLSTLYSRLGWMFVIGYIPSGWLADRVSAKILIVVSLVVTALAAIWYASIPSYESLQIIFMIWGFSSVFTFWSALMKAVKLLSTPEDEGRFFGALDGGRGIVEAVFGTVAVALFAFFVGSKTADVAAMQSGIRAVVYMYVVVLFVVAAAIAVFLSDDKPETTSTSSDTEKVVLENKEGTLSLILEILKNKAVYLMAIIIFTGYTLFWTVYYFSGFLVVNHGATAVTAGIIATAMLWMRPIGGIMGGVVADKFGKARILSIAMLVASTGLVLITLVPNTMSINLVVAIILAIVLMAYTIRGVYWSILDDCKVPVASLGVAIGLVSFVGYLPDIILPAVSNIIYTAFGDNGAGANNMYFLVSAGTGLVGAIISFIFYKNIESKNRLERSSEVSN